MIFRVLIQEYILNKSNDNGKGDGRVKVIYARVSSRKQANDLKRQIDDLRRENTECDLIVKDIASGVNFKRPGLKRLLKMVIDNKIDKVFIMNKDRLARIGFELLEFLFDEFSTDIVMMDETVDKDNDFVDDMIAVTTLFVASYNGKRAAKKRKRRQDLINA